MISYEIRKITDKNNITTHHVAISVENAVKDGVIKKIKEVEKLTDKLLNDLNKVIEKIDNSKNNVILHWTLGDLIYNYTKKTTELGFECASLTKMLEENMPKYKIEFWRRRILFREVYPDKKLLNDSVSFRVYHELLNVDEKERKLIDKMISDEKIKTVKDLKSMRATTINYK